MNKSQLFSQYNKARTAAREGKLDEGRVNRALGIAQLTETRPYNTTVAGCNCPDHEITRKPCKHMIAAMIEFRASQHEEKLMSKEQFVAVVNRYKREGTKYGAYAVLINGRSHKFVSNASMARLDAVIKAKGEAVFVYKRHENYRVKRS